MLRTDARGRERGRRGLSQVQGLLLKILRTDSVRLQRVNSDSIADKLFLGSDRSFLAFQPNLNAPVPQAVTVVKSLIASSALCFGYSLSRKTKHP